jgi:ferredoxin-thioredoxin reductase catalytic chain
MSEYEKNLQRLHAVAQEHELILNPDAARVEKVVGLMTENYTAVGEYVCPCKQQHKPPVKGADALCPCPEMMEEVAQQGHCFCRLFFDPKFTAG